jgi:hypothetical protein
LKEGKRYDVRRQEKTIPGIATGASMLAGSSKFAKRATAASHQFRFDTVQMPVNVTLVTTALKRTSPALIKNNIGVLGIKPMGDHIIVESETASPFECLHTP